MNIDHLLDEIAAAVGDGPPDDRRLAALAEWLPGAVADLDAVDVVAARAESARTAQSAVVAYRPQGPMVGLGWFPAGRPTAVHGHGSWGVAYVLEGCDLYERFGSVHDAEPVETRRLSVGDTVWWPEPPGDVHRQTGIAGGAVELVVVGRDGRTLVERAARCLHSLAYRSLAQLYAPDVLLDADVPSWRFQLQGRAKALEALRNEVLEHPGARTACFVWSATVDGGLVAQREVRFDGDDGPRLWRDVHVLRTGGGWITEHSISCTGIWDPSTIAQWSADARMVTR